MAKQITKLTESQVDKFDAPILFPWHKDVWDKFIEKITNNSIPHAILISGKQGVGKNQLSRYLSQRLLCGSPIDNQPCQECQNCSWFKSRIHPDFKMIEPEGKSETIKVDSIRDLCSSLIYTSHTGGYKIGLISQAERLNINAANSLLKSLEEPTRNTIFILHSHQLGLLPATIRSRCQTYEVKASDFKLSLQWLESQGISDAESYLKIARGAPLLAYQTATNNSLDLNSRTQLFEQFKSILIGQADLIELAKKWQKTDLRQLYHCLADWLMDLIRSKFSIEQNYYDNPNLHQDYKLLNKNLDLTLLFNSHEQVLKAIQLQSTSANTQLTLESLLVQLRKTASLAR